MCVSFPPGRLLKYTKALAVIASAAKQSSLFLDVLRLITTPIVRTVDCFVAEARRNDVALSFSAAC
jgi:hypothetical protein